MEEIIFTNMLCIIQRFIIHWSKNKGESSRDDFDEKHNFIQHSKFDSEQSFPCKMTSILEEKLVYRLRAIITRGLNTFYPLFEVHLCIVTFVQEQVIVTRVRYTDAPTKQKGKKR